MAKRPDDLFPIEERLTLREKAEIYHQTVTLPLKTRLEEVLADFFIEEDGEIERGRKVMEFVIHWTIIIGMFYGEIREELVHGCWAKVSFTSGTELAKANADFGEVKARFLIRHTNKPIQRDMFVRYGGREYEITYINDYAGRKYMEVWGTWKSREG